MAAEIIGWNFGNWWRVIDSPEHGRIPQKTGGGKKKVVEHAPWLFSADSFLYEPLPEREVLLEDSKTGAPVFYKASINQLFAFRGLGKTVVAHCLVGAMVNGSDWLRFHSKGGLRAIIVDGELPLVDLQSRLKKFVGVTEKRLALMSPDRMPEGEFFPVLSQIPDQVLFLKQIEDFKPDVIVFDTLTRCFKFDTNDPDDWAVVNDFLLELRFRGYCVIVVHHAGKLGTQRGRTDGDDNLDLSIKLTAPYGWAPGDGLQFQWDYEKTRHAGTFESFSAKLDATGNWILSATDRSEEVAKLLRKGKTMRSIAAELDMAKSTVHRIKKQFERNGEYFADPND